MLHVADDVLLTSSLSLPADIQPAEAANDTHWTALRAVLAQAHAVSKLGDVDFDSIFARSAAGEAAGLVLHEAAVEWTQVLRLGALVLGKVERNPQHLHPPPEVAALAATLVCTLVCTLAFAASPQAL